MFDKAPQPSANQPAPSRPSAPMQPSAPSPVSDPFAGSAGAPRVPQPSKPKIKTTGKMSSVGWVIIGLVVVGVIGVSGAFAYNRFINTPERIFDTAIDNLETLQSGTVDYQVALSGRQKSGSALSVIPLGDQFTLNFGLKTTFSKQADGFYQNQSTVTVDIPTGASLPWLGSLTFSPKVDLVMVEREQFYLKLLGIPFEALGLPDFNDQWIQISFAALEEEYGLKVRSTQDQVRLETVKATAKRLYRAHRFLVFGKKNTEAIDGVAHYHFTATVDEPQLKVFLLALDQDETLNELFKEYGSDSVTPEEIDAALAKLDLDGEFWINAKQKVFKRVVMNVRFDDEEMTGSMSTTMTLADYNQPITITAPTDYKTLQQIIKEMTAALMPAPVSDMMINGEPTTTAEIPMPVDSDADGLTDDQEVMYGTDFMNSDSDGDGYLDGAEVQNGYNPNGPGQLTF